MHQIIDRMGGIDQFLRISLGEERVRRIEDRYLDRLLRVHLLPKCINVPKELFNACANLFPFSAESFQLFVQLFDLLRHAIFLLAEFLNELNGLENTLLKAGKRIGFLIYVRHRIVV